MLPSRSKGLAQNYDSHFLAPEKNRRHNRNCSLGQRLRRDSLIGPAFADCCRVGAGRELCTHDDSPLENVEYWCAGQSLARSLELDDAQQSALRRRSWNNNGRKSCKCGPPHRVLEACRSTDFTPFRKEPWGVLNEQQRTKYDLPHDPKTNALEPAAECGGLA
jgi:hypothetical protein